MLTSPKCFAACSLDLIMLLCFCLEVWRALLKEMPLQSLLRILGKMTANKILEPGSSETQAVCDRIQSETALKKVGPIVLTSSFCGCAFN